MSIKPKESEWAKAQKIAESADMSAQDTESLKTLSTLLVQKQNLLEKVAPKAVNYESVLAEKLWAQIQAETVQDSKLKTPKNNSRVRFSWAIGLALLLVVFGSVQFYFFGERSVFDPGPLRLAVSDFVEIGATESDLESWLLSVSDSDTRYELLAQDLNSLERNLESLSESKDIDRVISEVKNVVGAN